MTNLFAVSIKHEQTPYIFCVADSQTTSHGTQTKMNNQKLVMRGHNLLMDTGVADIAYSIFQRLEGKDGSASEMADHVMRASEDHAKQFEGDEKMTTSIFIAGLEKDTVEAYEAFLINNPCTKRGVYPFHRSIYNRGSGSFHVEPALMRDYEMGFSQQPQTPLEALYMCFIVGQKADTDLGVNEKLQLGFVSPKSIRTMLAPGVSPLSYQDANAVYKGLTGIDISAAHDMTQERKTELAPLVNTTYAFYQAFEQQMHRIFAKDKRCNAVHTALKDGRTKFENYKALLDERMEEIKATQPLVDAFMQGGIANITAALRLYDKRQETFYAAAEQLAQKK